MGNPVVHFEIAGKHAESLREFYSALLGWNINEETHVPYMVDAALENRIGGHILSTTECPLTTYVTIYVQVAALQASLTKAERLGSKTVMPPYVLSGAAGSIAMFTDPSANCIGLYQGNAPNG